MATAPKKKAAAPAPKTKSEDTTKVGKKGKAAAVAEDEDEDGDEDEDEAPAKPVKKAAAAPAKKAKKAPEPEPEEEEDEDADEDGDEDEDADEAEEGDEDEAEAEDEDEITAYDELLDFADACAKAEGSKKQFPRFDAKKETAGEFQIRLLNVCGSRKVEEALFDSLSEAAQEWFNTSAGLLNEGKKKFPALEGFVAPSKADAKAAAEAPAKEERGAGLARYRAEQDKLRAEGKLPPKKVKAEPKGERKPKDTGTTFIVRQIVAANPTGSLEDHLKACAAKGLDIEEKATRSTIGVTRSGSLAMIDALKAVGSWTAPVKGKKAPEPEPEDDDAEEEEDEAPAPIKKKAKK